MPVPPKEMIIIDQNLCRKCTWVEITPMTFVFKNRCPMCQGTQVMSRYTTINIKETIENTAKQLRWVSLVGTTMDDEEITRILSENKTKMIIDFLL